MSQVGTGFLLGNQFLSKVCATVRVLRLHLQSTIRNLKSKIYKGGIAQLVERQLCKLEVRGSNPLASKAESVEAKSTLRAHYPMH